MVTLSLNVTSTATLSLSFTPLLPYFLVAHGRLKKKKSGYYTLMSESCLSNILFLFLSFLLEAFTTLTFSASNFGSRIYWNKNANKINKK